MIRQEVTPHGVPHPGVSHWSLTSHDQGLIVHIYGTLQAVTGTEVSEIKALTP